MANPSSGGFRRWTSLFAQASEGVLFLDSGERIVSANRAWEELTGLASADVAGKILHELATTPRTDEESPTRPLVVPFEALGGRAGGYLSLIAHQDGRATWKRVEFLPFHDREGLVLGFLAIFREPDAASMIEDARSQGPSVAIREIWEDLRNRFPFGNLVGKGPRHDRLLQQVTAATDSQIPVLIVGEPGTGKRHVARFIHRNQKSHAGPLIPFDPLGLPPGAIERELFADESAAESTILMGDVAGLPRDLQLRLLQALDQTRFRLLATSTIDPDRALRDDVWRSDFYFALTGLVVPLAPLRERRDELPLLAQHFLDRGQARSSSRPSTLSAEALDVLAAYDWPGNLRELGRVMERASRDRKGDVMTADDLPAAIRGELASAYMPPPMPARTAPLDLWLTQVERRLIEQALQRSRHNKSKAADFLQISRPRLNRRIKELNIPDSSDDGGGSLESPI